MKGLKKLATIIMAGVLMASMSLPVAAATTATVKIDAAANGVDLTDHTFVAYQIFTGTQAADTTQLGDIAWGSGINSTALLADTALSTAIGITVTSTTSAQSIAAALAGNDTRAKAFAEIANKHVVQGAETNVPANGQSISVDAGYWLVVDTTSTAGNNDVKNASLLQITGTGDFEIKIKTSIPSVVKKVEENENGKVADSVYGKNYNDVADYNIGDTVPFEFVTNVPDMSNYTNAYQYIFHDTMSSGLTFDSSSVKVYLNDTEITTGINDPEVAGQNFSITIPNLKDIVGESGLTGGQTLKVKFNATLNSSAVIGGTGNTNEVHLEYSNEPNGTGTGITLPDKVIVFTYELDTTKVDVKDPTKKLAGAMFVIKATDGVHSGKYVVIDPNTNRISGWANAIDTDGDDTKYTKPAVGASDVASWLTSDSNGLFKVLGLDDGEYDLIEVQAPAGYNLPTSAKAIEITATKNDVVDRQNFTGSSFFDFGTLYLNNEKATRSNDGIVDFTVPNDQGTLLPSTGGIGTTIFYLIGGIMILGAFVTFIVRRKMSANK